MANVAINNITDTWSSSGTTFTGIKFNVTDTSSATASLLMDLQVGGASKFSVNKSGDITCPTKLTLANGQVNAGIASSSWIGVLTVAGTAVFGFGVGGGASGNGVAVQPGMGIGWASAGATPALIDLAFYRDAANTLAQRNGVSAQTSRLYGTYTDASNYRRLTKTMSAAGVAEIKPEGGGTGATGNVLHISGLPTANPGPGILWNNAGVVNVGT